MSRVGSKSITIPSDVKVTIADSLVSVDGPKGKLSCNITGAVKVINDNNIINLSISKTDKDTRSLWGLYRSLINNMIVGVKDGFKKTLEINGVGYKANTKDGFLNLSLGFSHDVKIEIPSHVSVNVVKATIIELESHDKELLGLFASNIKKLRLPEPYKGKGVKYLGEYIIRKEGKK